MTTKHTAGPWVWFDHGRSHYLATPDRGHLYVMAFTRKGMLGAVPQFAHWDGIESGTERSRLGGILSDGPYLPNGELHPDARLIANAPRLLAALTHLLARAKAELADPEDVDEIAIAEYAIAKATQP